MTTIKTKVHFTDNSLIAPTNPIEVNLIGAGGTGSQVLTCLARLSHALITLGHTGLLVRLWDDDLVTDANLGRQLFAQCEVGFHKSVVLVNRVNRFFGTNWKAETVRFAKNNLGKLPENIKANLYISCVDSVSARFDIAQILNELTKGHYRNNPKYWIDFGNSQYSGQVLLSTIGTIPQPKSEKYKTVDLLPFVTAEYGELLKESEEKDTLPSCSLAEALEKQDLFINSSLAQLGSSLLWNLFRNGLTDTRGFFLNLKDFRAQPIKIT